MFEYLNDDFSVNASEYVNIEMVPQAIQESACVLPNRQFKFHVLECDIMKRYLRVN